MFGHFQETMLSHSVPASVGKHILSIQCGTAIYYSAMTTMCCSQLDYMYVSLYWDQDTQYTAMDSLLTNNKTG